MTVRRYLLQVEASLALALDAATRTLLKRSEHVIERTRRSFVWTMTLANASI